MEIKYLRKFLATNKKLSLFSKSKNDNKKNYSDKIVNL